jgi:uncharacterized protein YfbU (UPF0304 family)
MKLTRLERLILSNQYRMLEALYPDDADVYASKRKVVERGYELNYDWIAEDISSEVLSEDECRFVLDTLEMFRALKDAYEQLPDKSAVDSWTVQFDGFDGNNEAKYLSYARFHCESQNAYKELTKGDDFNSHMPVIDRYKRQLTAWKASGDKYRLTEGDVLRISKAAMLKKD